MPQNIPFHVKTSIFYVGGGGVGGCRLQQPQDQPPPMDSQVLALWLYASTKFRICALPCPHISNPAHTTVYTYSQVNVLIRDPTFRVFSVIDAQKRQLFKPYLFFLGGGGLC